MTDIVTPKAAPERDRWGRPWIVRPDGTRTTYMRATRLAGLLDDRYNLEQWGKRNVALGLAERPDLMLSVHANRDNKSELNRVCGLAIDAAKGSAAATTGTAIHQLTELVDAGTPLPAGLPDTVVADLDAYRTATSHLQVTHIEQMMVCDDIGVAGTADRIVRTPDGRNLILDLKTGSDVQKFAARSIATQLAIYANGQAYDPTDNSRPETPNIDRDQALVVHVPAGTGKALIYTVDIRAGWDVGVQLAKQVQQWRKQGGLLKQQTIPTVTELLADADTVEQLADIYRSNQHRWTDRDTQAAARRKQQMSAA